MFFANLAERDVLEASVSIQVNPSASTCFKTHTHSSGGLAVQNLSRRMHIQKYHLGISALNHMS